MELKPRASVPEPTTATSAASSGQPVVNPKVAETLPKPTIAEEVCAHSSEILRSLAALNASHTEQTVAETAAEPAVETVLTVAPPATYATDLTTDAAAVSTRMAYSASQEK